MLNDDTVSPMETQTNTALHRYIEVDDGYYALYEAFTPDADLVEQIARRQPTAHVVIAARRACKDCIRNIPRMTRIAESLPGWTWDLFEDSDFARKDAYGIMRVPTFIIHDPESGSEIGRIIENPRSGSLAQELLEIVSG